jgi:hypothetical protein
MLNSNKIEVNIMADDDYYIENGDENKNDTVNKKISLCCIKCIMVLFNIFILSLFVTTTIYIFERHNNTYIILAWFIIAPICNIYIMYILCNFKNIETISNYFN